MNYLILFICSFGSAFIHGGHVAEYHFQLNDQNLNLKFMIEKEELMSFDHDNNGDIINMTAFCTAYYVSENLSVHINVVKHEFEMKSSYTDSDHLYIILSLNWNGDAIEQIVIQNKYFYKYDEDLKNRIIVDVGRFQKSYLLNRERDKIELR